MKRHNCHTPRHVCQCHMTLHHVLAADTHGAVANPLGYQASTSWTMPRLVSFFGVVVVSCGLVAM